MAEAMAPRVRTTGMGRISSPIIKWRTNRAPSTIRAAARAWKMPITMAARPVCFKLERRNSLPMEKAIKPRAAVLIMETASTLSAEIKPRPSTPSLPRP